ncbi:MAG: DUF1223 domain-containing protein [Burkholderiaceae bacterium]
MIEKTIDDKPPKAGFTLWLAAVGTLFAVCAPLPGWAADMPMQCEAISPTNRVALVELYTSEGCSSCPPADKWLSALSASGLGANKVLPLALHVDYWDYIGWKDPFAMSRFTKRQEAVAVRNRSRSIYTPQVVLDGLDWRQWWEPAPFLKQVNRINQESASLNLTLSGRWQPGVDMSAKVSARVAPVTDTNDSKRETLHLAVFENQLETRVLRGENAGETLRHDAVVRAWIDPVVLRQSAGELLNKVVRLPTNIKPENMGLAAFVQDIQGDVVQAVSCLFKPET